MGCNAPCLVSLYGSLVASYVCVSTNFDDGSFVCEGFDVVDVCYGWVYNLGGFVCDESMMSLFILHSQVRRVRCGMERLGCTYTWSQV